MRIADIQIGERHRKDMGDLESLAQSIAEVGLLHPVVVTPDARLIAGERRIRACLMLGWTDIPATVVDLPSIIRGECDENLIRKDFTPTEAAAIAKELEPLERKAAKERQEASRFGGGGNLPPPESGKALDKVAEAVGMSRKTLMKVQEVVRAAEEDPDTYGDLPEKMDKTSIEKAYQEKRRREREQERAAIDSGVHFTRICDALALAEQSYNIGGHLA